MYAWFSYTVSWTIETPLPEGGTQLGAAAARGKVFVAGGWPIGWLQEYDAATGDWTVRANMPTARHALGVAALGEKIHAIGGIAGWLPAERVRTTAHEVYDPATGTWSARASMLPLGPEMVWHKDLVYAAAIGCHIYVITNDTLQEYTAPGP